MQRRTLMLWCPYYSVRDVHQLCFHAFIVTRFAAAVAEIADVVAGSSAQCA
jgi:hypothetical protein